MTALLWGIAEFFLFGIFDAVYIQKTGRRNETITVSVNNSQDRYMGTYYVSAKSTYSISVEDTDEGSDNFEAYDLSGNLLKTGIASGIYSNFDWWVD